MRVRDLVPTLAAVLALAACGRDQTAARSSAIVRAPDDTATPSRPWEVRSEAGLWRTGMSVNGRSAGGSRLQCHAGGELVPDEPLDPETRCDAPVQRLGEGGWVRERRCTSGGVTRIARAVVTGDLASGFTIRARSLDAQGAAGPDTMEMTSTYLRMGPCPDGWRPGEVRPEGVRPPPATAARPAESRPAPANRRDSGSGGTTLEPSVEARKPSSDDPVSEPPALDDPLGDDEAEGAPLDKPE